MGSIVFLAGASLGVGNERGIERVPSRLHGTTLGVRAAVQCADQVVILPPWTKAQPALGLAPALGADEIGTGQLAMTSESDRIELDVSGGAGYGPPAEPDPNLRETDRDAGLDR